MNENLLNRHNKIIKVFTYHNTMVVNDFTYFIAVTHRHLRCKDMKNNPNIQEIFQKNISTAHSRGTQATLPLPISQKKNGSSRTPPHNQRRHYQERGYEIGLLRLLLFQKDFQKIFRYHAPAIPRRAQGRHLAQLLRLRSSPRGRFRLRLIPQRQDSLET